MPVYFFNLRDGSAGAADRAECPDMAAAREHAIIVARELMQGTGRQTRHWRLEVCDNIGKVLATVPFASVDPALDHLEPASRKVIECLCEARAELAATMYTSQLLRAGLAARANGKPYLAAQFGEIVLTPKQQASAGLNAANGHPQSKFQC